MANPTRILRWIRISWRFLRFTIIMVLVSFFISGAAIPPGGLTAQVQTLTRQNEFDFSTWTFDAVMSKLSHWALSLERFLPPSSQSQIVLDYLEQVEKANQIKVSILVIYSDPGISDPDRASQSLREDLQTTQEKLAFLAPLAESILQTQLMTITRDIGLDVLGSTIPPSLIQTSDVPQNLVVSPRTEIVQAYEMSLLPGMTAETMNQLENRIFEELDHAALIVPIGGIGTYPTMIMQTTNLVWLTEVIAHEWVHNFLTLRPLGINYFTNSELRTINETTASLAGKELGRLILEKYYPEHLPPEPLIAQTDTTLPRPEPVSDPEAFDFRAEMRNTRLEVDRLLAEGQIEGAESYMEEQRQFFWENGFQIRKINQAYFAFYGAYNDVPGGGPSGADPVGPAVVTFRAQFTELADFLRAVSWVTSYQQLLGLLEI